MPRRSTCGPRSRNFAGSHVCHRWAGSTTWSSTLTIRGISIGVLVPCSAVAVTHASDAENLTTRQVIGRPERSGGTAEAGFRGRQADEVAPSIARSRHGFPSRLEVWVVPSTVMSRAIRAAGRGRRAHAIGVAGSPVVPTTTIGGAPGAETGAGDRVHRRDRPVRAREAEPDVRRAEDRRLLRGLRLERLGRRRRRGPGRRRTRSRGTPATRRRRCRPGSRST